MKSQRKSRVISLVLAVGFVAGLTPAPLALAPARAAESPQLPALLHGAWEGEDGKTLMNVEPRRITLFNGEKLSFRGVVRIENDLLILRNNGEREVWKAAVQRDGRLKVERGSATSHYRRLNAVPAAVQLNPLPLGPAKPLPEAQTRAIQDEIITRFRQEQDILKDPARKAVTYKEVVAANRQFLVNLIQEVGWIDVDRFGAQVACYATIMAKHTGDLRLMMTVLPHAERAFRDSGDGQTYAILYDEFHLGIGDPQRYGTQVAEDQDGQPYLLPVEDDDLEAVNERLRSMGVPPLEKYLKDLRDALYPGKEIHIKKRAIEAARQPHRPTQSFRAMRGTTP